MARKRQIRVSANQHGLSVRFGEDEIENFRSGYPASGLDDLRNIRADFDSGGDLVDLHCNKRNGSCERFDGPALVALIEDMQCAGEKRAKRKLGADYTPRCKR